MDMEFLSQLEVISPRSVGPNGMIVDRRGFGTSESFCDVLMECIDWLWEGTLHNLFKDKGECVDEHYNGKWYLYELFVLSTVVDEKEELPTGFFMLSRETTGKGTDYRWG